MKKNRYLAVALFACLNTAIAQAETLRYRLSGYWSKVADADGAGWGVNPNTPGTPGANLPEASDAARINWGGNTVTVSTAVPGVSQLQIGVDESGTVVVASGGVLEAAELSAGNNGPNAVGSLSVQNGGQVRVANILWAANAGSQGVIDVQAGAVVTVGSHLWWGVTGKALITIAGELSQNDGILGLGTNDAAAASGGNATVNILSGGKLNLNNISGDPGTPSIQTGSKIQINPGGQLTVKGDRLGTVNEYIAENKIVGIGAVPSVSYDPSSNLTVVSVLGATPQP